MNNRKINKRMKYGRKVHNRRLVFVADQLNEGQKVIIYTPEEKNVIDINGKVLGPKRRIRGTGYVTTDHGKIIVDSEKMGKMRVRVMIDDKEERKPNKKRDRELLVASPIDE